MIGDRLDTDIAVGNRAGRPDRAGADRRDVRRRGRARDRRPETGSHHRHPGGAAVMVTALTIAASDPSGGAGIQADLAVFGTCGVYGLCAVTNVTSQNSLGVHKVCKVPPNIIAAQIDDGHSRFHRCGVQGRHALLATGRGCRRPTASTGGRFPTWFWTR